MITEFVLDTEPSQRFSDIVRGADTNRHARAPQAAGMFLYDAFYRWPRDAANEGHGWRPVPVPAKSGKGQ